MSDWNKYVKQIVINGNKVTVKKIKKEKTEQLEEVVKEN